jgi:transposase
MNQYDNKFKNEYIEAVYKYRLLNLSDEEICEIFNITLRTLQRWKKKINSFMDSYRKGGIESSANIAARLYQKAIGYERKEEVVTNSGRIVTVKKYYQPDFKSIQYSLKNRTNYDKEMELKRLEFEHKKHMDIEKLKIDREKLKIEKEKVSNDTSLKPIVFIEGNEDYLEWKKSQGNSDE